MVTHGTDTGREAIFLTVVTYKSMSGTYRFHAPRNYSHQCTYENSDAITAAIDPKSIGRGVLVSFNEGIYDAREVMKMSTTKTNAFGSPNTGPVGQAYDGKVEYY